MTSIFVRQFFVSIFFLAISMSASAGIGDFFKGKKQDQPQEHIPSPVEELANNDVRKSRNVGRVLGGILGAGVAYKASENVDDDGKRAAITAAGAAAGVAIGGKVGEKIGQVAADRRRQYASEKEFLDSEIAASEKAITVREQDINKVNAEIAQTRQRVDELVAKADLTQQERKEAENIKQDIEQTIEENEKLLKSYDEKIAYLEHSLETSKAEAHASAEEKEEWEQRYSELKRKTSKLIAQRSAMQEQTQQLAESREDLEDALS